MLADTELRVVSQLAVFLDGMPDAFTGSLLTAIHHSDDRNRNKLAIVFPWEVAAFETWAGQPTPPTAAGLCQIMRAKYRHRSLKCKVSPNHPCSGTCDCGKIFCLCVCRCHGRNRTDRGTAW
jgi:hypothetical protein